MMCQPLPVILLLAISELGVRVLHLGEDRSKADLFFVPGLEASMFCARNCRIRR
jgi:hypothetical protein